MRLKNKVALITGAGSGIGRASAILFAKEGTAVAVNDIDSERGEETVETIKKNGGEAFFIKADVSKAPDCKKMIRKAIQKYGRIDILFNNAGVGKAHSLVDTTEEEWDWTIDVNLKGVFLGSRFAVPYMIKQGGGVIINTASISGLYGSKNLAAYCASKGGVVLLTKAMACDLGQYNIRVNCICPSHIRTPGIENLLKSLPEASRLSVANRYPLVRFGKPEEVARLALYLASDESSFTSGASFVIDGGVTAQVVSLTEFVEPEA